MDTDTSITVKASTLAKINQMKLGLTADQFIRCLLYAWKNHVSELQQYKTMKEIGGFNETD